jgi:benzodiazapine receptor
VNEPLPKLPRISGMNKYLALAEFIVVVVSVGMLIGYATAPGAWYLSLEKPPFTPPNWVFPVAWTIIYVLIAVAGWRVMLTEGMTGWTGSVWFSQMVLNWAWSPVFFGLQMPFAALAVIVLLLFSIIAFLLLARDDKARLCFLPYAGWVGFASVLNGWIAFTN